MDGIINRLVYMQSFVISLSYSPLKSMYLLNLYIYYIKYVSNIIFLFYMIYFKSVVQYFGQWLLFLKRFINKVGLAPKIVWNSDLSHAVYAVV